MKRKVTTTVETDTPAEKQIKKEEEHLALEDFAQSLAPQGASFYVYRMLAGRQRYIARHDGVFTEEDLLAAYGPGSYLIRPKIAGKWIGSRIVDVEGPPAASSGTAVHPGNDSLNERLFLMQTEHANRLHELLLAVLTKGGSGADPHKIVTEMVTGMVNLQKLAGGATKELSALDQIDKVLTIADKINGNHSPKSTTETLLEMAKDALPLIMAGRSRLPEIPAASSVPDTTARLKESLGERPAAAAEVKGAASATVEQLQQDIARLWTRLERRADRNDEPEAAAGMLLDLEDDEDAAATVIIESLLQSKTFEAWEQRTRIEPQRRAWFQRLFAAVIELTKDPNSLNPPDNLKGEPHVSESQKNGGGASTASGATTTDRQKKSR